MDVDGYTGDAEKAGRDRYFLRSGEGPEHEVDRRGFAAAEADAGFRSKNGPGELATDGFSVERRGIASSGRIAFGHGMSKGPEDVVDTEQGPMPRRSDLGR